MPEDQPILAESSPSPSSNDMNVDDLASSIEGQQAQDSRIPDGTPEAPPTPQEFEFVANGKPIKAPIDKILRWASSGYNAPQQIAQYKRQALDYQNKLQAFEDQQKRYGEVDEYVKQNPAFWDHVLSQWQAAQNQAQSYEGQTGSVPPELIQEIHGIKQVVNQFQQERIQAQHHQEDQTLLKQIQSTREKYNQSFDWETPNDEGLTLEAQVLDFGIKNGLKDFETAFYMFKKEDLFKHAEDRGRESLTKDKQRQTKLGLLGKTPTPTKGMTNANHIKAKTYDQLMQEGLEELGIDLGHGN